MMGFLVTFAGEIRKGLLVSWTYRANALASILTIGFVFVSIGFMLGGGQLEPEKMGFMFLGYLNWFYALGAINDLSYGIRSEMNAGTLEQMSMSPAPIGLVIMGRAASSLIWNTIILSIQSVVLFWLLKINLNLRWEALVILLCTLVGTYGFSFILAGATIIFKQFESFSNLFQNVILFLNGTLLPTAVMPGWLAAIALVMPTTQGIIVLRRVVLEGASLASVWQDGSLVWLVVNSVSYLIVGWVVFSYCENVAKRQGSLGQY